MSVFYSECDDLLLKCRTARPQAEHKEHDDSRSCM